MTDSSGQVVWSADYKPFGEATVTVSTITNNLQFPGRYFDAKTGLNYNYFRDYNPAIGKYKQADPIGIRRGRNHLYAYVGNNPVRLIDSRGLAVGDWWDLPANYNRAEAIAHEELALHQGHNNSDDAMRHAEWSQRMTDELGGGYRLAVWNGPRDNWHATRTATR